MSNITEFLNELTDTQSISTLRAAHIQKSPLIFKVETHPTPVKALIDAFLDKRAILALEPHDVKLPLDKEVSIKFNVGTEVFFIKTSFKTHLNRYFFDMGSKVIELRRRREPRYLLPKKWPQSAFILGSTEKENIACKVIDISLSGIRLELLEKNPFFNREDFLKIKFQIYKRAEVSAIAVVKFVLNRNNQSPILGLELLNMTDVQRERVAHIVDDIQQFNSTNRT